MGHCAASILCPKGGDSKFPQDVGVVTQKSALWMLSGLVLWLKGAACLRSCVTAEICFLHLVASAG